MTVTQLTDRHEPPPGTCPDAELLASYIDGRSTNEERALIESHIVTCEDCYFVLAETVHHQRPLNEPMRVVETGRSWTTWVVWGGTAAAVAAALMLAFRTGGPVRRLPQAEGQIAGGTPTAASSSSNSAPATPQVEALTAALTALETSAGEFRPLEPRLSRGFDYRPLKPVTRSPFSADEPSEKVRELALAAEALAKARKGGVDGQRALAEMYLITGKPDRAVEILESMTAGTRDAGLLTDLAAAYLARRGPDDPARARDAAERAVEAEPRRAEAWFNLALAAEALDLPVRAADAWRKFLELDRTSGWADEARHHLDRLNRRTRR